MRDHRMRSGSWGNEPEKEYIDVRDGKALYDAIDSAKEPGDAERIIEY